MTNSEYIKKQEVKLKSLRRLSLIYVIILVIALGGNIFQYVYFIRNELFKNTVNYKSGLIDSRREFINQKDVIINLQPLREYYQNLARQTAWADVLIYFESLNTGANIIVNPDIRFYPASLVKLPVAMAAMKKIENEVWQPDNELVLMENDVNIQSGELFENHVIGSRLTIEDLIKASLVKSDNTSHNMLFRNLDASDTSELIDKVGLYDLFSDDLTFIVREYTRLLRALYTASYLNLENSQKILYWMTQSEFKDFLSQGIDEAVPFAHKYAENKNNGVYADSDIVYLPNRPFKISVAIKNKQSEGDAREYSEAHQLQTVELAKDMSKKGFDYVKNL